MNIPNQTTSLPLSHPAALLATWFGVGLVPKASGTAGSLAALPIGYLIHLYLGTPGLVAAAALVFFIGWWASAVYVRLTGRDDPKEIVIDEVVGQWLLLAPFFPSWNTYLWGFILFRLFDILKPWPISVADRRVGGGFGVMLDDVLAACYPITIGGILLAAAGLLGFVPDLEVLLAYLRGNHVF